MQHKTDTKKKLNAFDFILIAVLIIAIAGAAFYFLTEKSVAKNKTVVFTVELPNMEEDFDKKIKIGDDIKDSIKGYYLGKVKSVEVLPYEKVVWDIDSYQYVLSGIPDKYFVNVTIEASGSETEDEIKAEDVAIRVGKQMSIKGRGYAQTGYVIMLETHDKGAE